MAEKFDRQKDYHIAKIRKFVFYVISESTSRGQKTALHEYPNRDDRFAEPLGKAPPILGLTCVVFGENYFQQRLEFEKILETPGVTELIHPIYGAIDVQPGPYTVTSNQREIGKFIFNVTFYTSVDGIGPAPLPDTPSVISKSAVDARNAVSNAFQNAYLNPEDGFDLGSIVDGALGALDAIQDGIDAVVGPIQSAIATVSSTIKSFRDKIFKIAQTGIGLKNAFDDLYNDILQLSLDLGTLTTAWQNLMGYNVGTETDDGRPGEPGDPGSSGEPGRLLSTSLLGPVDTVKRNRNETNKSLVDEQTRITGLIGVMESIAFTEFATADELIEAVAITDERFSAYFQENEQEAETGVAVLANDNDVRVAVLQLRAGLKTVLDDQLSNVWRTTEADPGRSSMALTAYRYYGDHETLDDIINLNPDANSANFNKEITLVTK